MQFGEGTKALAHGYCRHAMPFSIAVVVTHLPQV